MKWSAHLRTLSGDDAEARARSRLAGALARAAVLVVGLRAAATARAATPDAGARSRPRRCARAWPARRRRWPRCTRRPTSCCRAACRRCARAWRRCAATPVVVNKWASWCEPCRAEFGVFQRAVGDRWAARWRSSASTPATPTAPTPRAFLRSFPVSYPSYYDQSGQAGVAITDSTLHAGDRLLQPPRAASSSTRAPTRARPSSKRTSGATRWSAERCPRCASTRSAGTGRSSPASARAGPGGEPRCDAGRADRPRRATRSPRATRTARRRSSTRCARRAAAPNSPGWTVRVVPNLYPALEPAPSEAPPTGPRTPRARPSRELFSSLPATRRARGDRQRPAAGALAGRTARSSRSAPRSRCGASGCARTRTAPTCS